MISILLLGEMIGIIPNSDRTVIEGRKTLAESLAVQYSVAAQKHDIDSIKTSMRILVERNAEVLSAALRSADGRLLAVSGNHNANWKGVNSDHSTPTHAQVPIYQGSRKWGTVEVSFTPLKGNKILGFHISSLVSMVIFITVIGFAAFLYFIKKTHQNIDPAAVVPSRVRSALDALAEGVLLLDTHGHIIMANSAFAGSVAKTTESLMGIKASSFNWQSTNDFEDELPWDASLRLGEAQTGKQLLLACHSGITKTFMVNSAPVKDGEGKNRGVMVTFDDVTQIEEKNDQLEDMLGMLKKSRDEIRRQNRELQVLATRDPLTDCLNRRSFYEKYETIFNVARNKGHLMSCIMVDIDMFKSVNDRFGHAIGDEVIKSVAGCLLSSLRSTDTVCRYGGEEFCIVLPGIDLEQAVHTAERARNFIASQNLPGTPDNSYIRITASFGVTSIHHGADNLAKFIDQADKALYMSKNSGRNRVSTWTQELEQIDSIRHVNFVPGVTSNAASQKSSPATTPDTAHAIDRIPATSLEDHEYMPGHDSLTGLPNRKLFHKRIIEAVKYCRDARQFFSILILDLDMFKRINNALGYTVGDALLKEVSRRLNETLRSSDSVSRLDVNQPTTSIHRLGGDEFGIMLTGLEYSEFTAQIVNRLIESLTRRIDIDEHEIHLTCSVGISLYPDNGADSDTLLKNAGVALYYAKCQGHNSFQFYNEELRNTSIEDLKLENELRHAIENNELELYYQPKVGIKTGKVISMEALLRWRHPQMGMIPPTTFIPVAESTGLITSIGSWVLRKACLQSRVWQQAGYENVCIAVNLSAVQFRHRDLLEQVSSILDETGMVPGKLELEITETTIMEDIDAASETMRILHGAGINISIDDFGTGYSSLNHLKRFPISTVKIDRSFIRDITTDTDDKAIIKAIIDMAHNMGLKVIAEGVESNEQLVILRDLQCDEMQGFLFSPPVPVEEAESILRGACKIADYGENGVRAAS
jgi:diguanylate cyclase (GGDEF)-like protein/PAS domain S-box-containing protein